MNAGYLSDHFPELVDEKGNGWFHHHVKSIIRFLHRYPELMSKPVQKKCHDLSAQSRTKWKNKVKQMQVPAFAVKTKAACYFP